MLWSLDRNGKISSVKSYDGVYEQPISTPIIPRGGGVAECLVSGVEGNIGPALYFPSNCVVCCGACLFDSVFLFGDCCV